ncbi:MAG: DoxX family protein [Pseudomonadota bacterium]
MHIEYSKGLNMLTIAVVLLSLAAGLYEVVLGHGGIGSSAAFFLIASLAVSIASAALLISREFRTGFLLSLLAMLIGWRVAGLNDLQIVVVPLVCAYILYLAQFANVARNDLRSARQSAPGTAHHLTVFEWQLTLVRLLVGLGFAIHCAEKLFAGSETHMAAATDFAGLGVPYPGVFVWLAGACELAAAIGVGLGVLTRLAALLTAVYLVTATALGGHFANGYIWANDGGGWEYPFIWVALVLGFVVTGAGRFSIDGVLRESNRLPRFLRVFWKGSSRPARP